MRAARLVFWMALSLAGVAILAVWDETREANDALAEFATSQADLAAVLGAGLEAQLAAMPTDQARARGAELLPGAPWLAQNGALALVLPPGAARFVARGGRTVDSDVLRDALHRGTRWVRLSPRAAGALGLAERTAIAGLASVVRPEGTWALAIVTSVAHERDRQKRARWRLALSVLLAAGLVLAFGGVAFRNERREATLGAQLARAERERERETQLERESRAAVMVALAGGVAHELSTPLGVVAGRAELLEAEVASSERATKAVRAILEQADRMRRVIEGFLRLARGDAPAMEAVDLARVVDNAVALVEHRFTHAGVRLHVHRADTPIEIRGAAHLVEHALVNLLLNACDASPPDTTVEISLRRRDDSAALTVEDEGSGISAEDAGRVLEPFFSTKPAGKGTGLGLAIANEIVKIHRGQLRLEPRTPRGTRAEIRIPMTSKGTNDASRP